MDGESGNDGGGVKVDGVCGLAVGRAMCVEEFVAGQNLRMEKPLLPSQLNLFCMLETHIAHTHNDTCVRVNGWGSPKEEGGERKDAPVQQLRFRSNQHFSAEMVIQ